MSASTLIRNAAAILTGEGPGDSAATRVAGPDIRIRGETIEAIGALAPQPGETIVDATDCIVYPVRASFALLACAALLYFFPEGVDAGRTRIDAGFEFPS